MTDHKFTDEEVIKALECCRDFGDCSLCPYDGAVFDDEPDCVEKLHTYAIDLINRQKAEIDRLQHTCDEVTQLTEKAQENCSQCGAKTNKAILNMQKAFSDQCLENERLKAELEDLREIVFMDRSEAIKNLKAEAVKEFAERLKASTAIRMRVSRITHYEKPPIEKMVLYVDDEDIDNLAKEMTGG